jgi:D-alanyl-D-alanine carboxypeptidase
MLKRLLISCVAFTLLGCSGGTEELVLTGGSRSTVPPEVAEIIGRPLYKNAVWGLRVVDLGTNEVLIDERPTYPFFIASVRKAFSVGVLLNEVGPTHTYDTPVFRQGNVNAGVLDGDLVLVASGDLTMGGRNNPDGTLALTGFDHNEANGLGNAVLSAPDPLAGYKSLAKQVADSGITQVSGDVIIDDRLFQPFDFRGEFDVKPIFVNDDVVDVSLTPTSPGNPATVDVRPQSLALAVVNSVSTGAAGSEMTVELDPEIPDDIGAPGATAEVKGTLPIDFEPPLTGAFPLIRTFRISDPSNYARTVFVEALEAEGVIVDADTVKANPVNLLPAKDSYAVNDRVAVLTGRPYRDLGRFIMKVSYNLGADVTLLLYGLTQGVDNLNAALAVENDTLTTEYGLSANEFHFVDGSGGGPTTATTRTVTAMLTKMFESPHREDYLQTFPKLAIDGSLSFVKDFQSNPTLTGATAQVCAKTGTFVDSDENGLVVRGQAYAGYINTRSGRRLVYQLVVNEVAIESLDQLIQIFQDQGIISAILWRDF